VAKRTFNAFIGVQATVYHSVTIEWTGDEDPTEDEIAKAFLNGSEGLSATQCDTVQDFDDLEVTDIEEDI